MLQDLMKCTSELEFQNSVNLSIQSIFGASQSKVYFLQNNN